MLMDNYLGVDLEVVALGKICRLGKFRELGNKMLKEILILNLGVMFSSVKEKEGCEEDIGEGWVA